MSFIRGAIIAKSSEKHFTEINLSEIKLDKFVSQDQKKMSTLMILVTTTTLHHVYINN